MPRSRQNLTGKHPILTAALPPRKPAAIGTPQTGREKEGPKPAVDIRTANCLSAKQKSPAANRFSSVSVNIAAAPKAPLSGIRRGLTPDSLLRRNQHRSKAQATADPLAEPAPEAATKVSGEFSCSNRAITLITQGGRAGFS